MGSCCLYAGHVKRYQVKTIETVLILLISFLKSTGFSTDRWCSIFIIFASLYSLHTHLSVWLKKYWIVWWMCLSFFWQYFWAWRFTGSSKR